MKRALLLAGAMVAAVPAWAEWTFFAEDKFNNKFYFDYSTLRSTTNGRRVWALLNLAKPEKNGTYSSKALLEIDCVDERRRILQSSLHKGPMGSGESSLIDVTNEWRYASPQTIIAGMVKDICHRS